MSANRSMNLTNSRRIEGAAQFTGGSRTRCNSRGIPVVRLRRQVHEAARIQRMGAARGRQGGAPRGDT